MANPWFRLYSEFADDPKVQMMPEAMQRRLVMLMCLKHKGELAKLDPFHVAFALRISLEELQETFRVLQFHGFLDGSLDLVGWRESQAPDRPCAAIWIKIRDRIFKRDDYTCRYCGRRGVRLECDHVVPVSRGGSHEDSNLVTACFPCNRSKRDHLIGEWIP